MLLVCHSNEHGLFLPKGRVMTRMSVKNTFNIELDISFLGKTTILKTISANLLQSAQRHVVSSTCECAKQ